MAASQFCSSLLQNLGRTPEAKVPIAMPILVPWCLLSGNGQLGLVVSSGEQTQAVRGVLSFDNGWRLEREDEDGRQQVVALEPGTAADRTAIEALGSVIILESGSDGVRHRPYIAEIG